MDTTCPWVAKVWNAVDNQARKAHTSIIHGKASHEETRAAYARCAIQSAVLPYIEEMPAAYAAQPDLPRAIADYIAGMTDRFAAREHERLTGRLLFSA